MIYESDIISLVFSSLFESALYVLICARAYEFEKVRWKDDEGIKWMMLPLTSSTGTRSAF
jgi:hypothetical protein